MRLAASLLSLTVAAGFVVVTEAHTTGDQRSAATRAGPSLAPNAVLSPAGAPPARAEAPRPVVRAPTAILVDGLTGTVLFAKRAGQRRPVASLTKLMTAMLVLDRVDDLTEEVRVSRRAARQPPIDVGLEPGQRITVRNLLWGMLLWSGNDTSVALAEHVAGSVPAFLRLMNARAMDLGLADTHFASPSGLSDRGYSTVRDLAVLARTALGYPVLARTVRTRARWIPGPRHQIHKLRNLNALLATYPGAVGMKTGYTRAAGDCVVGAAVRGARSLVAVVLGEPAETHWRAAYGDVSNLLDYGFALPGA